MHKELSDIVDEYIDQEGLNRTEGSQGVRNLCRLVRALGYRDTQNFGQFDSNGCYGDLIAFLEDNSGAVEEMIEWIRMSGSMDWKETLSDELQSEDDCDEDEE